MVPKRLGVLLFMVSVIVALTWGMSVFGQVPEAPEISRDMTLVSENDYLALYINQQTTEIMVWNKESGDLWYSVPPGARDNQRAQISIRYYAPGAVEATMDSYRDSVIHDQFEIIPIEGGVRVDYVLGQQYDEFAALPGLISKARVQEIVEAIEDDRSRQDFERIIDRNYTLISLVRVEGDDAPSLPVSLRVFEGYTLLADGGTLSANALQRLMRNLLGRISGGRVEMESISDVTFEDFKHLEHIQTYILNDNIPDFLLRDVLAGFVDVGYTLNDKVIDNELNNLDPPLARIERFRVAVDFVLDGRDFVVTIPSDLIEYPRDVVDLTGKYGPRENIISLILHSINVLEYFGAADQHQSGYMFVPDGSGALIHLNRSGTAANRYVGILYGDDLALNQPEEKLTLTHQLHLPVFGIKQGDRALMAIIEQAQSSARINASVSTGSGSFNRAWGAFVVRPQSAVSLSGDWQYSPLSGFGILSKVNVFQQRMNEEDIVVRYRFFQGDQADYAGMAKAYRDYLLDRGDLRQQLSPVGDTPFFVELIGGVNKTLPILGIPRIVDVPLTTYAQAAQLAQHLDDAGVDHVVMKYTGWHDRGVEHGYPTRARLNKTLGTMNDFLELRDFLYEREWEIYPDVSFPYVYKTSLFDGFSVNRDASRTIDRKIARRSDINLALFELRQDDYSYVLSPRALGPLIHRFTQSYESLGIGGLSLRYLGTDLHSDFQEDPEKLIDRQQAQKHVELELSKLSRDHGFDLMVTGANSYVFPYVKYVLEMPFNSSGADIFDEDVPFLQMVLHGLLDYAGTPINFAPDPVRQMLKTLEYGASIYFKWSYEPSEVVKDTKFHDLYATYYQNWFTSAIRFYRDSLDDLKTIRSLQMVGHEKIDDGIYRTRYDGGYSMVVNYNRHPVHVDGIDVQALNYVLLRP